MLITDQLHLSPVKATVQLRPSFQHFDAAKAGERRRKQPEEVSRPRAVQVSVSLVSITEVISCKLKVRMILAHLQFNIYMRISSHCSG